MENASTFTANNGKQYDNRVFYQVSFYDRHDDAEEKTDSTKIEVLSLPLLPAVVWYSTHRAVGMLSCCRVVVLSCCVLCSFM